MHDNTRLHRWSILSDRISEKAICPFYLSVIRSKHFKGVECESLDKNLGFHTSLFVRLDTFGELRDFTDIFCCDMYKTCPYYKAIIHEKYNDC